MKLRSSIHVSDLSSFSKLPDLKDEAFYIIAINSDWKTTASKAFFENKEIFAKELADNLLIILSDRQHIEMARKYFKSTKYDDPTLIITSTRPDKWEQIIETSYAIKICFGGLKDYDSVVKTLMKISDLLRDKDKNLFKKISWESKKNKVIQLLKDIPVIDLISLTL